MRCNLCAEPRRTRALTCRLARYQSRPAHPDDLTDKTDKQCHPHRSKSQKSIVQVQQLGQNLVEASTLQAGDGLRRFDVSASSSPRGAGAARHLAVSLLVRGWPQRKKICFRLLRASPRLCACVVWGLEIAAFLFACGESPSDGQAVFHSCPGVHVAMSGDF